jgi:hypothetical protein
MMVVVMNVVIHVVTVGKLIDMENKPSIGLNDDYACAYISDEKFNDIISMYYGYEVSKCPVHPNDNDCDEADCDKSEWCFKFSGEGLPDIQYTTTELENFVPDVKHREPAGYVLAGMLKMLSDGILKVNQEEVKKIFGK